jgi:hypothetical protein
MSSILDALNKVEEDRNAQSASDSDPDAPFAPETAAEALIAQPKKRRSARQSPPFNWKPIAYAAGGLVGMALLVGLSAGVAVLIGGASPPAPTVALAARPADTVPLQAVGNETYTVPAPAEKANPATQEVKALKPMEKSADKPVETRAVPVEVKPKQEAKATVPAEQKPRPTLPVVAKVAAPEPVRHVVEEPSPALVIEPVRPAKPAPVVPEEEPTTPLPTEDQMARVREAAADAKPPAPVRSSPVSLAPGRAAEKHAPFLEDINTLPRLGQTERERLGLGELRLNVLRAASPSQPEGLAIINLKKVYVGEAIPGTNARLIAVQTRAIAIEIDGTGERFKVTN